MDIEEQIEKAEKLDTPSLVGSSIRSADDLIHQNYIHPEKYKGGSKTKPKKHSILDSSIGASLDDLINEGALLGSEEDFDRFLDDTGHVKLDARYIPSEEQEATPEKETKKTSPLKQEVLEPQVDTLAVLQSTPISAVSTVEDPVDKAPEASMGLIYENENYSAPNLSEYQLDHQISDHSDLLDSVKSYDLSKLPSSADRERSKTNSLADSPARVPRHARPSPARRNPSFTRTLDYGENANVRLSDSLHTPYFPSYERSPSRSRASVREKSSERERSSRSTSTHHPHLARGDTYKSTHPETPLEYEMPADIDMGEESGEDDRATRHSKPTMGESIAAAEQQNLREFHGEEGITRDPSLVTTGDYTNFNVDSISRGVDDISLYSKRSEASTNYLRSISRSRSRQPKRSIGDNSEKNDANPEELAHEGALISDDPFDQVENFDNVMQNVVSPSKSRIPSKLSQEQESEEKLKEVDSEPHVTDVSAAEKDEETKEQLLAEKARSLSAKDIHVDESEVDKSVHHDFVSDVKASDEGAVEEPAQVDEPAEEKIKEAREQLIAEEAPIVTAADIKLDNKSSDKDNEKEVTSTEEQPAEETAERSISEEEEAGTEEAPEASSEDKEEKANLITEPGASVSEAKEAEDIKAEELPASEEAQPNLVGDEAIEPPSEATASETVPSSVDEDGNVIEEKTEEAADAIETDEHGAKVPDIDFDAEQTESTLAVDETAAKPSLIGETGNDDKELEAEAIEAVEAATDEPKAADAESKTIDAEEKATDEVTKTIDAESEKIDDENKMEQPEVIENAEAEESEKPEKEAEEPEKETEEPEKEAEQSAVSVVDAPETEGEVVETKDEPVPTEEEQAEATEIVANEELEETTKDAPEESAKDETAEEVDAEQAKDSETEEAPEQSTEETKESISATKDTEETETSAKEGAESKEISEESKAAPETAKSPESASKGWFGLIRDGIGAVVGGVGASQTEKEATTGGDDELDVSPEELKKHLQSLPVYIFTSLAGGMQIMQRTNRLTTILQANGVKFEYRDLGTDEEAKKLWRRYAQGKTLPGVVRGDDYIGNWQEIDELNEEYMLLPRLWEEL